MNPLGKIVSVITLGCMLLGCKKDGQIPNPVTETHPVLRRDTLAKNLKLPWGLAFLPNGDLLFTQRNGKISLLEKGAAAYQVLQERSVNTGSEGGLLSIAVDPDFDANHFIYIYETTTGNINRVVRLRLTNTVLSDDKVLVDSIPYGVNHDGGALKFGPDGYLYIGTGDGQQSMRAQDKSSLAGKILRVSREGVAAPGNPFNSLIWTYGHRNVQGFTWINGQMLATEHGPSGENGWCCHDEINFIEPGKNYGWPLAMGGTETGSLTPALVESGNDTWAPSGCTYLGSSSVWPNTLVVATLRGQRLLRFRFFPGANTLLALPDTFQGTFNRLRNVTGAPDGSVVFCTSNINSIPSPAADDDKIYTIYRK